MAQLVIELTERGLEPRACQHILRDRIAVLGRHLDPAGWECFATHDGAEHFDVFELIRRADVERIAIKNGEVRKLAGLDGAFLVILMQQVGRA